MALNPYAKYLAPDEDPSVVIAQNVPLLETVLARIGTENANTPIAPGKWTIRDIVAHLADCEIMHGSRLRLALEMPGVTVQPWDQDKWAVNYSAYTLPAALDTFKALRGWNLALLTTVSAEQRSNLLTHPERGTMTLWTLVETMAGHDRNHLQALERFAGKA